MDRKDPRGYYKVLNVSPDASPEEIRLSYGFRKQSWRERHAGLNIGLVQEAYDTLRDTARRAEYDGATPAPNAASSTTPGWSPARIGTSGILGALLLVLVVVVGVMYRTEIRAAFTRYSAGDVLYDTGTGGRFGTVVRYEAGHRFENGAVASAYLIEEPARAEPAWYPAHDLERICRR
jgi:DnaJ-like protein